MISAGCKRRLEQPGEEIVAGNAALVGDDRGAKAQHRGRIVGGGVGIGDGAADGAAIAHQRIADAAGQRRERRDRLPDHVGTRDIVVARHGADRERGAVALDAGDAFERGKIDDVRILRQTQLERRQQAHAAGEQLCIVFRGKQVGRLVELLGW